MTNIISIYKINGIKFQEINYDNIDNLSNQLTLLIKKYNSDILIQLLINENILNNYDIINNNILVDLSIHDFITIVFIQKKELYCLGNDNGKYILNNKNDNYSKLLELVILYNDDSYNLIKNTSYKNIVYKTIKYYSYILEFSSFNLKNDKKLY